MGCKWSLVQLQSPRLLSPRRYAGNCQAAGAFFSAQGTRADSKVQAWVQIRRPDAGGHGILSVPTRGGAAAPRESGYALPFHGRGLAARVLSARPARKVKVVASPPGAAMSCARGPWPGRRSA